MPVKSSNAFCVFFLGMRHITVVLPVDEVFRMLWND